MSLSALIDRFTNVKQTGPSRWLACCPAHDDKSPSLSLEDRNGYPLIHCFSGCEAADVLAAVGATWQDVMPPREGYFRPQTDKIQRAEQIHEHETFLLILKNMIERENYTPSERELDRARQYQRDLVAWRAVQ